MSGDLERRFQEVPLLCHAVCGGSIDAVKLLLERGADVKQHSGKLLTLAVVMNRVDLVKLLIEQGADVQRVGLLGRLDDPERPVADLRSDGCPAGKTPAM